MREITLECIDCHFEELINAEEECPSEIIRNHGSETGHVVSFDIAGD